MKTTLILGALLSSLGSLQAAVLLGNTVRTTYEYPAIGTNLFGPTDAVVAAGVELVNFAAFADIDFSDTNILIKINRNAGINAVAFDGFHFFDLNSTIPAITSVTINAATNYAGFDASRIAFDANNIYVNVVGLAGLTGQVISLDINQAAGVPEPASLSMIGLALAGLSVFAKRSGR